MAEDKDKKRPIIIVKRKRGGGGGHHGGAWKVAYADFVTAMMAFFMVMWLVASVTKEQRAAIFDYFNNPSMEEGRSVKPAPGQNGPGGASTSPIDLGGGMDAPKSNSINGDGLGERVATVSEDDARKVVEAAEQKQLDSLMAELREAVSKSQALEPFKDQLLLDITPEGLRIQIVDKQNRPMFDLGGTRLKDYTGQILGEIAQYLNTVPNRISLSGHTDDKPYAGQRGYSNWDLSADRANAARRALQEGGLEPARIARVVGLASSVLFDKQNPYNPINRRISIIVMTKSAEAKALSTDAPDVDAAREQIEAEGLTMALPPELAAAREAAAAGGEASVATPPAAAAAAGSSPPASAASGAPTAGTSPAATTAAATPPTAPASAAATPGARSTTAPAVRGGSNAHNAAAAAEAALAAANR